MQPCVIFGIPSYDNRVCYEFFGSMLDTERLLTCQQISHGYIGLGGDQFIARVRNKLATQFLRDYPEGTDLFFLDDDIGWPAEKIVEFLKRPEDIVAGIYPKRQDKSDFPVEFAADPDGGALIERNGLIKALAAPAGFMRIRRHVLERMAPAAGVFHEREPDGRQATYYDIFRTGVVNEEFSGEDFLFCQNARLAGFEIWVDPNIDFTHRGTKAWSGNLSLHLRTFHKQARSDASQPMETIGAAAHKD
jgi:hypothetical protein